MVTKVKGSATALTAGQSLTAVFKRQKGKWYLQQAIRVA